MSSVTKILWISLGCISVGLGALGVILPILPTTPFLIFAAFCFARSSKRLHDWLLANKTFGPAIRDWNERGAISVSTKRVATITMFVVLAISFLAQVPQHVILIQIIALSGAATFILTRPS